MISLRKASDCFLIFLHFLVLGSYIIKKPDIMEFYFDFTMNQLQTDAEKIEQLEKWDLNHKFDIPPLITPDEWRTFWLVFRGKAYHRYQYLFNEEYVPPMLRNNEIVLTDGGNCMKIIDL